MGMTIDEAIKYLKALKRCETCEAGDLGVCKSCSCYRIGSSAKCYDAIDVGVDTMRKYEKIRDIIKNNNGFTDGTLEHSRAFTKIAEVVEDDRN